MKLSEVYSTHSLSIPSDVLYTVRNNVAYITLNRPDKMNSLHTAMLRELLETLNKAEDDKSVRVIVIEGNSRAFCSGQDLKEILGQDAPSVNELMTNYHDPVVEKIRSSNKPVIAAVQGVAAGAGAVFAIACDLVIASENASFIFGFSHIGLTTGSGGSYFLSRLVGTQKAAAMLMLGEKIAAQRAENIGMIYKVIEDARFENEIINIAEKLATMPSMSIGLTKKLLSKAFENDLTSHILQERESKCLASEGNDFKEGLNAFVNKRKPVFNVDDNDEVNVEFEGSFSNINLN